jgi:EAL domain-containing protein (putative c-di-GMP-specific phosphodiesterase class I)
MDIQGVEALIRWQHPTKGVIAPDSFIPVLEESGLIVNVGRWVIDTACAQAGRWRDRGFATTMSVNVSMKQLERDALVDEVERAIVANHLDPGSLTIEVTESALMRDVVDTMERLNRLKAIGVSLAIDDFGTGYSSLAYLRRFPVDVVKIDKSFISEIDDSPNSAAFIHTLVELGRTLGLITIAEGIEDDAQLTSLRNELCDRGQGYLFSRPVDPDSVEELLRSSHHRRLALPRS